MGMYVRKPETPTFWPTLEDDLANCEQSKNEENRVCVSLNLSSHLDSQGQIKATDQSGKNK